MNKISALLIVLVLAACSPQDENKSAPAPQENASSEALPAPSLKTDDQLYSFDINTLAPGCNSDSQIVCAINLSVKCTINPDFSECSEHKDEMPSFVFMRDESLKRPTSQSYKINKIKPISQDMVEIYTQSTCNGNWFGLCNGNIIYVMGLQNGNWIVKDLYAIES